MNLLRKASLMREIIMNKKTKKIKNNPKAINSLAVVLSDLIIDSFIEKRRQTKAGKARHNNSELKDYFRNSDGRPNKSESA